VTLGVEAALQQQVQAAGGLGVAVLVAEKDLLPGSDRNSPPSWMRPLHFTYLVK
jgi:hypothetical protein